MVLWPLRTASVVRAMKFLSRPSPIQIISNHPAIRLAALEESQRLWLIKIELTGYGGSRVSPDPGELLALRSSESARYDFGAT